MSTNDASISTSPNVMMGALYIVITLLVIVSNSIVMIVIFFPKNLHSPSLCSLAFMALCDCCYGLHYLVFAVPSAFLGEFAYPGLALFAVSLHALLYGQNALNILLVTIDRYLSVFRPLKYPRLMNAKRWVIAILVTVAINVGRLCCIIFPDSEVIYANRTATMHHVYDNKVKALAAIGVPFVTFVLIVIMVFKLVKEIFYSRRMVHPLTQDRSGHQFTITLCVSTGVYCLAYLPSCVAIVWSASAGNTLPHGLPEFILLCLLSNSLWNVVIYTTTYRPFRNGLLRLFCKGRYRRLRQQEMIAIVKMERDRESRT